MTSAELERQIAHAMARRLEADERNFVRLVAQPCAAALERARSLGLDWRLEDTTYYLAALTLFTHTTARLGMMEWRDKLFIFLSRNARRATNYFQIPPDRVVEIGIQLEI